MTSFPCIVFPTSHFPFSERRRIFVDKQLRIRPLEEKGEKLQKKLDILNARRIELENRKSIIQC